MKTCHVCYCVDKDFEKYAIASMISLLLNAKIKPIIHVIHNKFTDKKMLRLVEKLFKAKFKYYLVDDKKFYGLPVLGGYSVYYRILIPELLPKNIKKVLYLDCDTIVEGDLNELFSIDLSNKALAAVEDLLPFKIDFKMLRKRLKIPKNKSYFNSGVMLLNLDYLREKDFIKKIFAFMKKNPEKLVMHDQDALNAVLHNHWISLDIKYNYITMRPEFFLSKKNINLVIVHFAVLKPEMIKIIYPGNFYCKKYYEYLSMTPLPKEKIKLKDMVKIFKRIYYAFFQSKFFF